MISIRELDGEIIIDSIMLNDNIFINSTLDDCEISVIEYNNDLVDIFGRRVIYTMSQRINIINDFDFKDSCVLQVFIDDCDYYSILILLEPEDKTKKEKYTYALKIKSLCEEMPNISYNVTFDSI